MKLRYSPPAPITWLLSNDSRHVLHFIIPMLEGRCLVTQYGAELTSQPSQRLMPSLPSFGLYGTRTPLVR